MTAHISCDEAKQADLVDYLFVLGHRPEKQSGSNYWYLSPLREEKHASFVVNRKKNLWYDFGTGEGGTIIDFGMRYFDCPLPDFLWRLQQNTHTPRPVPLPTGEAKPRTGQTIKIQRVSRIVHPALCAYLRQRRIPLSLARKYCREVHYELYDKTYFALGFQNNAGGYELRNNWFKGSNRPKDITTIIRSKKSNRIAVFEGFFNFLSFLRLSTTDRLPTHFHGVDILVLNTLAFLKKSRVQMEPYKKVHLFLDLDQAGDRATQTALGWGKQFHDERTCYCGYPDCNAFLVHGDAEENRRTAS